MYDPWRTSHEDVLVPIDEQIQEVSVTHTVHGGDYKLAELQFGVVPNDSIGGEKTATLGDRFVTTSVSPKNTSEGVVWCATTWSPHVLG